jgi:hypothetical protein
VTARGRFAWATALLLLVALAPWHARADEPWRDGSLDACVEAALPGLRAEPFLRAFLSESAARSRRFTAVDGGCVAFVAVAAQGVLALELGVHTEGGDTLATDARLGRAARLQYCGGAEFPLVLTVEVKAGLGAVHVLRTDGGTRHLGAELAALDACDRGGPEPGGAPTEIGMEPAPVEAVERLVAANTEDLDAGAERVGPPVTLRLEERETRRTRFRPEEPGCYVVIAAGEPSVFALRATVERRGGEIVARAQRDRRSLRLPFCIDEPGSFALSVHATAGRGEVATQWVRFREPDGPRFPGLEGSMRAEYARLAAQMRTYGLLARPLAWAHLRGDDQLIVSVPIAASGCVALGTVAGPNELPVPLFVEDAGGRLLAARTIRERPSLVHVCDEQAQTLRVGATAIGGDATTTLLVVGEAAP